MASSQSHIATSKIRGLISNGKCGVGKSTITADITVTLAARSLRVGSMDTGIYGPTSPGMLGLGAAKPKAGEETGLILPLEIK